MASAFATLALIHINNVITNEAIMKKLMLIILFFISGCGGLSLYSTDSYMIVAKQTTNGNPTVNYPVRITYPYDHYGIFYIWNAPNAVDTFLDEQGCLELKISNFSNPQLIVGSTVFTLNKTFFQYDRQPFKHPYQSNDERYKRDRETYVYQKLPLVKYPEVDIIIDRLNKR
jgi:hypothetical protein